MKELMKLVRIIFVMILGCLISNVTFARDGKVKYTRSIEYRGFLNNKAPDGKGFLIVFSKVNSKTPLLTIEGEFSTSDYLSGNLTVSNANLSITDGLTISAPNLTITINKGKKDESIKFHIPNCNITDGENGVDNVGELLLSLDWTKRERKEWKFKVDHSGIGTITKNFISTAQLTSRLADPTENPVQQMVNYEIIQDSTLPNTPYQLGVCNVKNVLFVSGLKVSIGNTTDYSFPNGDYANYTSSGKCSKLKLSLPDGSMIYNGDSLSIAYSNGDKFIAKYFSDVGIKVKDVLKIKSLSQLKLNSGVYTKVDSTSETYLNGKIVGRYISGGLIQMGDNSTFAIKFDNGVTFTGLDEYFIKNRSDFLYLSSVNDAIFNNGKLVKSSDIWDIYHNGAVTGGRWPLSDGGFVEYKDSKPIAVKYADGSSATGIFQNNYLYKPELKSSDFELRSGKFVCQGNKIVKFDNGYPQLSNVADIYWYANLKGYEVAVIEIAKGKCDLEELWTSKNNIKLQQRPMSKQINNTDYFLQIAPGLCLTYPKSFVTKGYNYSDEPLIVAETCDINIILDFDDHPYNPYNKSYMVWTYKRLTNQDGVKYGITKGLYIIERDWGHEIGNLQDKILYDVSETFVIGHNKSFKKVYPAPKKKKTTYHERGRVENCVFCVGTGQGLQGGYCPFCGGKGWYIEHVW